MTFFLPPAALKPGELPPLTNIAWGSLWSVVEAGDVFRRQIEHADRIAQFGRLLRLKPHLAVYRRKSARIYHHALREITASLEHWVPAGKAN